MAWSLTSIGGLVLLVLYVVRYIHSFITVAQFKKKHGCKEPTRMPQQERVLGLELYLSMKKISQSKMSLDNNWRRFQKNNCSTITAYLLGMTITNTMDPENIKAILATNFKDFGLGTRLLAFGPLLGSGIFTTDGAAWEHSRVSGQLKTYMIQTNRNRPSSDPTSSAPKLPTSTPSNRTLNN